MTEDLKNSLATLMEAVVAFSMSHVDEGGIPFSAFVVGENGAILGRGVNCVREHHDPTSHAEIEAIRDACRTHKTIHLREATLLASGEPCAMCYMSAVHAGFSRIFFAVDRYEAAKHGFDYRRTYAILSEDPRNWSFLSAQKFAVRDRLKPFLAFRSRRPLPRQEIADLNSNPRLNPEGVELPVRPLFGT